MAKEAPITLSSALGVSTEQVLASGVVDVTLNCDTNLFPDPLLMREASDEAFANAAYSAFVKRFERIISLLVASNSRYDKAERAARELLTFP